MVVWYWDGEVIIQRRDDVFGNLCAISSSAGARLLYISRSVRGQWRRPALAGTDVEAEHGGVLVYKFSV